MSVVLLRKAESHKVLDHGGKGLWRQGHPVCDNVSQRGLPDVLVVESPVLRVIRGLQRLLKKKPRVFSVFAFFMVVAAIRKRKVLQRVQG